MGSRKDAESTKAYAEMYKEQLYFSEITASEAGTAADGEPVMCIAGKDRLHRGSAGGINEDTAD